MNRRGNHEGTAPRLRADGRYQADYTGSDGRRRSVIARTPTDCRAKLRDSLRQAEDGQAPLSGRLTVGGWLDQWLANYVAGGVRPKAPRTVELYESVVRVHLKPQLGRVILAKLTREQVAKALAGLRVERTGEPLAASSLSRVYVILGAALDDAVKSDRIRSNPVRKLPSPTFERTERTTWTVDEINAFLDAVSGDRHAPLYGFAIATGLRQGELLGLRWVDVDQPAGVIRVVRQWTRTGTFTDAKTAAGRRVVGLGDLGRWALASQEGQQRRDKLVSGGRWANLDGLVFTDQLGAPLHHRTVWSAFQVRVDRAGVRRIRFHDLRHAFATLLFDDGEELGAIAAALGHTSVDTTKRVYAHLLPKRARATASRIDAALGRQREVETG
jgi:integrase